MKIAAFVYDFEHEKSSQGLLTLKANGFNDVICLAAPKKILNIQNSKMRISPKLKHLNPNDVANSLGYQYFRISHDDQKISDYISDCDIGVILGARIIKPFVIHRLDIINMHPGLLPYNRGLDNLKWAIVNRIPMAVTTHIIDQYIDRGFLLSKKIIPVEPDDTIMDIHLKLKNTELTEMVNCLNRSTICPLDIGTYYKPMPDYLDDNLSFYFEIYKKNYKQICDDFVKVYPLELQYF